MSAMVILPSSIHHPKISTLEIGSHFMCECCPGEGRGYMAVYQIINYDSDTSTHTNKVPAVNCSTGFVHLFPLMLKLFLQRWYLLRRTW